MAVWWSFSEGGDGTVLFSLKGFEMQCQRQAHIICPAFCTLELGLSMVQCSLHNRTHIKASSKRPGPYHKRRDGSSLDGSGSTEVDACDQMTCILPSAEAHPVAAAVSTLTT